MQTGVDHIGIACIFVCYDDAGRVLMTKRSQETRDEQGKWEFGGGQVHFGESLPATVTREMLEEICAEPQDLELVHAFSSLRDIDGRATHWVILIYAARIDPTSVRIGEPHKVTDIGWFSLDALPSPLHSQVEPNALPALRRYFERLPAGASSR